MGPGDRMGKAACIEMGARVSAGTAWMCAHAGVWVRAEVDRQTGPWHKLEWG